MLSSPTILTPRRRRQGKATWKRNGIAWKLFIKFQRTKLTKSRRRERFQDANVHLVAMRAAMMLERKSAGRFLALAPYQG
jgi:hypothetical protein